MYKYTKNTSKTKLARLWEYLAGILSFGVVIASTHGALIPDHHQDLTPTDFSAKVISDLHTHADFHLQSDHILVDPKQLRSVRSEGDKTAESDGLRGNWDVYQA
jgi:hypothetical protein